MSREEQLANLERLSELMLDKIETSKDDAKLRAVEVWIKLTELRLRLIS